MQPAVPSNAVRQAWVQLVPTFLLYRTVLLLTNVAPTNPMCVRLTLDKLTT